MGEFGIETERFQILAPRLFVPVQPLQDVAQVVMMNGKIWLEPDRLLAVNQSFLGLAAVEQNQREPAPGRRIPGRQLDGETQVFDRLVKLPELP